MGSRSLLLAAALTLAATLSSAATFTVNTTSRDDDANLGDGVCLTAAGTCSFYAAIYEANMTPASDTILFAIPGPGPHRIDLFWLGTASLYPVVIDGFSQPGSQPNTNPTGGLNTVLKIELSWGMQFRGGGNVLRGLVLNGASFQFFGPAAGGTNVVEGCFVGTDPSGTQSRSPGYPGIRVEDTGGPARIGGILPAQRNLISGHSQMAYQPAGVHLQCLNSPPPCNPGTVILGNLIGTTASGLTPLPNFYGVLVDFSGDVTIGGPSTAERNVISGNQSQGIVFQGNSLSGPVRIHGNRIGTDDSGTLALPNDRGVDAARYCFHPACAGAGSPVVEIGGIAKGNLIAFNRDQGIAGYEVSMSASSNTIRGNGRDGVSITQGQWIADVAIGDNVITDNLGHGIVTEALNANNPITVERNEIAGNQLGGVAVGWAARVRLGGNRISGNGALGIDLDHDGVTPNDPLDPDTGPNDLMNFPVIARACPAPGGASVAGSLPSRPALDATIEVFRSAGCDASGHGEGAEPRAVFSVTTNGAGDGGFQGIVSGLALGDFVTATATGPNGTSEFSACVPVTPGTALPQSISGPAGVCAGTPYTLVGTAGADVYQWFLNGTPIAGATGATLGRATAAPADAGSYTVQASRCGATATSTAHALSVVACGTTPLRLEVDLHTGFGTTSDLNGILEPGESVLIEPRYRNDTASALAVNGTAALTGPAPGTYAMPDANASYGTIPAGQLSDCYLATGDCYGATVGGMRPQAHWDALFVETTTSGDPARHWPLHVGETFTDVPRANPFYRFVETLIHQGVTAGCTGTTYCPGSPTTRGQMSVFVLIAREGRFYRPPACNPAAPRFTDVPAASPFCRWIEELARRNVVSGCGGGNYCPAGPVSREQMAVFVLATKEAPGYSPPACVAGAELFADVPASSSFCRWIEELARRNVVAGCGNGNYCPAAAITRGEMSVFLTGTFGLLLYGP